MKTVVTQCNLHKICEEKGLTIRDLAKNTGISETQLYNLANQGGNPRLETISRIMVALECDFTDLFKIKSW